ncbi:MAG: threonine/serine exporter family protein [Phycisphaeraceae bacterium]|nr:threonine/serine exporter family protein [Phycisphaeraceae bacterium]MCW5753262.1 threonine/serine exporter family protein [Phycisphaeraceae bacterium]
MSSDGPLASPETRSTGEAIRFMMDLGKALHVCGTPAHRIEEAMTGCAQRLGLDIQVFSTPTSLWAGFGPIERQRVRLVRIDPAAVNLGLLSDVDEVASKVVRGELPLGGGTQRLETILSRGWEYPSGLTVASGALASAVAARLFGGGLPEVLAGAVIGLVVGVFSVIAGRHRHLMRIIEFACGAFAAALALALTTVLPSMSTYTATVAGLIVLMPGLTLTLAMNELATRHLVSGTTRLMYALMIFFSIGFGVAFGRQFERVVPDPGTGVVESLPLWTEWVALACAGLAYTVLFKARPLHLPVICGAVLVGFGASRLASVTLGPEIGVCVGAFVVGAGGNLYSRLTDRPGAIVHLPGLMVLVPGSIGFKSLDALLDQQVVSGVGTAFQMVMVGAALVAGLLLANVAVTPRKAT